MKETPSNWTSVVSRVVSTKVSTKWARPPRTGCPLVLLQVLLLALAPISAVPNVFGIRNVSISMTES